MPKKKVPEYDQVDKPIHYTAERKIEPIDAIEDWQLNFHLACSLKYIARMGRKGDAIIDCKKAIWYLQRHLKNLEAERGTK